MASARCNRPPFPTVQSSWHCNAPRHASDFFSLSHSHLSDRFRVHGFTIQIQLGILILLSGAVRQSVGSGVERISIRVHLLTHLSNSLCVATVEYSSIRASLKDRIEIRRFKPDHCIREGTWAQFAHVNRVCSPYVSWAWRSPDAELGLAFVLHLREGSVPYQPIKEHGHCPP